MSAERACGLRLEPPVGTKHRHPTRDIPPATVMTVVRFGHDPELRRAVRVGGNAYWTEHGYMVNYYADRTPPMRWVEVGTCWANDLIGVHRQHGQRVTRSMHTAWAIWSTVALVPEPPPPPRVGARRPVAGPADPV